jgi:competence protein ComGF
MRTSKASTLIEILIALMIMPIVLSISMSMLNLLTQYDYRLGERQNFIALIQLRKRVALGSQIKINGDRLQMNFRNREIELICDENKLYELNGYMEYLTGIDRCIWNKEKGMIFLSYVYESNAVRVFIGYEA